MTFSQNYSKNSFLEMSVLSYNVELFRQSVHEYLNDEYSHFHRYHLPFDKKYCFGESNAYVVSFTRKLHHLSLRYVTIRSKEGLFDVDIDRYYPSSENDCSKIVPYRIFVIGPSREYTKKGQLKRKELNRYESEKLLAKLFPFCEEVKEPCEE